MNLDQPQENNPWQWESIPEVKPGDIIYIPGQLHVYRGSNDIAGGQATVLSVEPGMSAGVIVPFIRLKEYPNTQYNWEMLSEKQDELRNYYGDQLTHETPDFRPEFNDDHW